MVEFKVGDVVERTEVTGYNDGLPSGVRGVVSSVGFGTVKIEGYGDWQHIVESLRLVVEQDDPLPPAPESALYVNRWRWGVGLQNLRGEVRIGTGNPNSKFDWVYATLDPDAALQLAHDLNRMANEIKRKEKQNA